MLGFGYRGTARGSVSFERRRSSMYCVRRAVVWCAKCPAADSTSMNDMANLGEATLKCITLDRLRALARVARKSCSVTLRLFVQIAMR